MRERGYSYIELIVVISLIAVTLAVAMPAYRRYIQQAELGNAVETVRTQIRTATNNAAAGVKNTAGQRAYWYIQLTNDTSTIGIGACTTTVETTCHTNSDYRTVTLPSGIRIAHNITSFSTTINLYFDPITSGMMVYKSDGSGPASYTDPLQLTISRTDGAVPATVLRVNKQGTVLR